MNILLPKLFLSFLVCFCFLFTMGCSEQEQDKFKKELKELLMTKEEKEEIARKEREYLEKIKQEALDSHRKETAYNRAKFEIKKMISEHLRKKDFRYSEIVVYDIYVHNNNHESFYNYYKVDFSADIIQNPDIFTKRTDTVIGDLNFRFFSDEENYVIDGYQWRVSKENQVEFSDGAKDAAKFLFDKFTENN